MICISLEQQHTGENLSMRLLRNAYFQAAKECHPDSSLSSKSMKEADLNERFLQFTKAYELSRDNFSSIAASYTNPTKDGENDSSVMREEVDYITKSEKQNFR